MSQSGFYRAFEERYRGSRELIRSRLEAYRPFIEPLAQVYPAAKTIDLGCGRGEWLELMQDCGFTAHGVDIDRGMLEACHARGLSVTKGDAIEYLKILGAQTQGVVSGFHIAEHITFKKLETLVINALRVLKPGGLLILETPNPENLQVGTCNFYLDPTHNRPIPPLLLSFIPEHYGYARTRIVRLQEAEGLVAREYLELMEVLNGVSPDYAVIAQKSAAPTILEQFDAAFAMPYGIELHQLAGRYNHMICNALEQADQRLHACEAQGEQVIQTLESTRQDALQVAMQAQQAAQQAEERAAHAEQQQVQSQSRITDLDTALSATRRELHDVHQANHRHWQLADARQKLILAMQENIADLESTLAATQGQLQNTLQANHLHWALAERRQQHIDALLNSLSWRMTAPLRLTVSVLVFPIHKLRELANATLKHTIEIAQRPLSFVMAKVLRRPQFSKQLNEWLLRRYPALHGQLLQVARRHGVVPPPPKRRGMKPQTINANAALITASAETGININAPRLRTLTPHARIIYADLKAALAQKAGGKR